MSRTAAFPLLLALALRLLAIGASDRVVGDVKRYAIVSDHLLDVSWNPYETRRLYPYPPPWALAEAAAGAVARRGLLPFPVAIKLPVLLADLLIVALLARAVRGGRAPSGAPWIYAAHPVALLVGGVHGQFDSIALLFVLLALAWRARPHASAGALGAAIAAKSFPVLLVPSLACAGGTRRAEVVRYAFVAAAPVALLLLPFALVDARAVARELFAYGGIADFGWTGLLRALRWLATGTLERSEALFWPAAALASKVVFLVVWLTVVLGGLAGRLRLAPHLASLAIVLAFLSCYGLLSAQYLLWPVPLALLGRGRFQAAYAAAASVALVGFYLFLAPGLLWPRPLEAEALAWAGRLWTVGVAATLAVSITWLLTLLWRGLRATTEAR